MQDFFEESGAKIREKKQKQKGTKNTEKNGDFWENVCYNVW